MTCPTTVAMQLTTDYFESNQAPFSSALADGVVFTVKATICSPGAPDKTFNLELEGKELVIDFLAKRHFSISKLDSLPKIAYTKLDGNRVKVIFTSIETKKETEKPEPVTYKYDGHYIITLTKGEEGFKVEKITLENRRVIYSD